MSSGARSEVITSCRPASSSALKVWKNSSRVRVAPGEELDVVDEDHVRAAKALLEAGRALHAHGLDELARELLDRRVAHAQPGAVALDVVADRVQQVRLADPGRAVQEERVVGLAGQLGDRQRRGVGEAVAVADHELVEGVLRVQAGVRRSCSATAAVAAAPGVVGRRLPVGADDLHDRAARRSARPRRGAGAAGSARRPRCGCARARARRGCSPATAASSSGSSQMWNLKSGVSRRSSSRMSSQSSSGCAGTGGRDPPRGPGRILFTEGRDERETSPRRPRRGECTPAPSRSEPGARRRLRKTREKRGGLAGSAGCRQELHRRTRRRSCTLRSPTHEAHLSAQEAQARPHPRLPCAHEHPRRPRAPEAPPRQGPQAAHPVADGRPCASKAPPAVPQRRVRARLPRGPLPREPSPRRLRVPALGRRRRGPAPRRLRGPQARRRRRAQPHEAPAAGRPSGRAPRVCARATTS